VLDLRWRDMLMLLAFLMLLSCEFFVCANDVILKPLKSGKQVGVVFIQGTQYYPNQYAGLLQVVQAISELSVWAAIPQFENNRVNPQDIPGAVERALDELQQNGLQRSAPVFFVGEYVGGAYLQDYLITSKKDASGLILLGSFLSRENRIKFSAPSLTIGGGRDGLVRVTRLMESYYHQILHSSLSFNDTCRHQAVVVLQQITHAQFADGTAPSGIKGVDFQPTIHLSQAQQAISWLIASFIAVQTVDNSYLYKLLDAVKSTGNFLEPLLSAFTVEGYYSFKPPCYDNPPAPSCTVGSPWMKQAMTIMAGLKKAVVNDTDGFHPVSEIKHIHHPKIENKCVADEANCTLNIVTACDNIYMKIGEYDMGVLNASAIEIQAKMKSRQAAMEAVGEDVNFNNTDGGYLCSEINSAALKWAISITSNDTLTDYLNHGQQLVIGKDKGPYDVFPEWEKKAIEFIPDTRDGKLIMLVNAVVLRTSTKYIIPDFAGMHYCKLLSPARAIEWIYIDSRRLSETL